VTSNAHAGVSATNDSGGFGVWARGKTGVYGTSPGGVGVWGSTVVPNTLADDGDGVLGEGKNGVHGRSKSKTDSGVWGENTSSFGGTGVAGSSNVGSGVTGSSNGGTGVAGNSVRGFGVTGVSQNGYGGQFTGGFAPLHLTPGATTGHPTSGTHEMGEFYVDSAGVLFYNLSAGTPGNWKIVHLV